MSFALCVAFRIIHFKPATALRPIAREASGEHARAAVVNAEGDERAPAGMHSLHRGPTPPLAHARTAPTLVGGRRQMRRSFFSFVGSVER